MYLQLSCIITITAQKALLTVCVEQQEIVTVVFLYKLTLVLKIHFCSTLQVFTTVRSTVIILNKCVYLQVVMNKTFRESFNRLVLPQCSPLPVPWACLDC